MKMIGMIEFQLPLRQQNNYKEQAIKTAQTKAKGKVTKIA